ncbi:hypothetical protein ACG2F4_06655 [Halalkalibaculum sp. DA3122]|uniref:hypothetical protein n=1 Tax=Halalkalibaculum sp. DA3122 TaxID=3373607 RepID=UPI0037551DE4
MEHTLHYSDQPCGCGCTDHSLANGSEYLQSDCGCHSGLGESGQDETNSETQKDLIKEAKKYINSEIPTPVKVVAGLGIVGLLLVATRGKK